MTQNTRPAFQFKPGDAWLAKHENKYRTMHVLEVVKDSKGGKLRTQFGWIPANDFVTNCDPVKLGRTRTFLGLIVGVIRE